jgi:ribonuclease HII
LFGFSLRAKIATFGKIEMKFLIYELYQKLKRDIEKMTDTTTEYEFLIGIDEAGRGPLFGRVYAAAVILPRDLPPPPSRGVEIKDSKKFHSLKKIHASEEYIKSVAVGWAVAFEEAAVIDEINIRRANFRAMHSCIHQLRETHPEIRVDNTMIVVDGNDFIPYRWFETTTERFYEFPFETIVSGDATYPCISAASILAKCARDCYIRDLCVVRPELAEHYGIDKNMGYGTKQHIEGIKKWGMTDLHRQSFTPHSIRKEGVAGGTLVPP